MICCRIDGKFFLTCSANSGLKISVQGEEQRNPAIIEKLAKYSQIVLDIKKLKNGGGGEEAFALIYNR